MLSTTEDGVTTSFEYQARREDSALLLVNDQQRSVCDAECRAYREREYGITAGTLTSIQTEETLRLVASPATPSARAQVAPTAAPMMPETLQARVAIRPRAEQ